MNDLILNQVDIIIDTIKNSKEYQEYQELSNKLKKNQKVMDLIKQVKLLQQQIVKKEVLKEDISLLEKELSDNLDTLNKIPLYLDFIEKQEVLNELYQTIKTRLDNYFYQKLN